MIRALLFSLLGFSSPIIAQEGNTSTKSSIHKFKVKDIDGKEFDFSSLKGKKILIVNTASKCGFTSQYKGLQELYQRYKNKNFIVIGFPANNFRNQEPSDNSEIKTFCTLNYNVSFPMMAKVSVKGDDMADIYKFLTLKEVNGVKNSSVKWNFQKYLIDEEGYLVGMKLSIVNPLNKSITNWIEGKK